MPKTLCRSAAGTACVYSKKVEYLHNLVYQALEAIVSKKHGKERNAAGGDNGGVDDGADDSDEDTFLCLDDTLQVG